MLETRLTGTVGICETQPATVEGVRSFLSGSGEFQCKWAVGSLLLGMQLLRQQPVRVVLLDKALGLQGVIDTLNELRHANATVSPVVWGISMSEPEALRLLQSGARGILRKNVDREVFLTCMRSVAEGRAWMESCVFRESGMRDRNQRSDLTARERQVLELVEQGMKNREIAEELGIRPGTVKIHLKHIFEKTGVHGRYGLALNGIRQRGGVHNASRTTLGVA